MFIIQFFNYISGYIIIALKGIKPEKFVNQMLKYNIKFWDLKKDKKNNLTFKILKKHLKQKIFVEMQHKSGVDFEITAGKGLRCHLERHKYRLGVYLGSFIGICIIFISTFFIWDVKIVYSDFKDNSFIIDELENYNVKNGTYKKSLDIDMIQNNMILRHPEIKWIAINLKGTVANIEIKKRDDPIPIDDKTIPANIIAKKSGKIIFIETYEGQQIAARNSAVNKGDLLVSGLIDSNSIGMRVKHAAAKIIAETSRMIIIKIPLTKKIKLPTGKIDIKSSLLFFGREINLFIKKNTDFEYFRQVKAVSKITILDKIKLPVSKRDIVYTEFNYKTINIDKNQAKMIAYDKIDDIINTEFIKTDINIISKEYSEENDQKYFYLTCNLTCMEDIAQESSFETNMKTEEY